MVKNAIIFAAGFGKRMLPVTKDIPKPLVKIREKTLIDIIIDKIFNAGIKKIYINCHYKSKEIINHIEKHKNKNQIIVVEEEEILETGGAFVNLSKMIDEEFCITTNVDVIWQEKFCHISQMIKLWNKNTMNILALLHEKDDVYGYYANGDFNITQNNMLVMPDGQKKYMYMGVQIINTSTAKLINKNYFSISEIYKTLANKDKILEKSFGFVHSDGMVIHVGDVKALEKANLIYK